LRKRFYVDIQSLELIKQKVKKTPVKRTGGRSTKGRVMRGF